jgi:hypothetical protein
MSLSSWYYEWIKIEYGGGVHLPSHEGEHRWGDSAHGMKALGEMYLLSTCDVLVTSGFSNERRAGARRGAPVGDAEAVAVGEVEGGPGGAEPPCRRVLSVEPSLIFSRRWPWLLDLLSGADFLSGDDKGLRGVPLKHAVSPGGGWSTGSARSPPTQFSTSPTTTSPVASAGCGHGGSMPPATRRAWGFLFCLVGLELSI